jgi:Pyruvate/2-oxoacid:ferredoxin oxidoreductase delta subunit
MKTTAVRNNFFRLNAANKTAQINQFAGTLFTQRGKYTIRSEASLTEAALLARGIKNVLVSERADQTAMAAQISRVLGLKTQTPVPQEPSLLFNVPESLAGKDALLFTSGTIEQTETPQTTHTKISLADVKAGFTDFGEEMINFMELNGIESMEILTDLTVPRYQRLGFGGAVYENNLGLQGDVGTWHTFKIRVKASCELRCFDCIISCPTGAVTPIGREAMLRDKAKEAEEAREQLIGGVKIDLSACKGCRLCILSCHTGTILAGEKDE